MRRLEGRIKFLKKGGDLVTRLFLPLVLLLFLPVTPCTAEVVVAGNTYSYTRSPDFLSDVSPDYKIKRNPLALTKVTANKHRRAFMFVFLMNKDSNKEQYRQTAGYSHRQMHVLWTGSKKIVQPAAIENEYPVDFSIANYDEGFASREWNLVLPNKKPREVTVSFMWSF